MYKVGSTKIAMDAGLYIAATPIGNLGDITLRVLQALEQAQLILAEDTRRTRKLLSHFAIQAKPLRACHDHSKIDDKLMGAIEEIIHRGEIVLLVSDAGTPLISDPGFALVNKARALNLPVFALPGPSALSAALCVLGMPSHRFCFGGFLPNKTGQRKNYLKSFDPKGGSLIFFESPQRLVRSLEDMAEVFGVDCSVGIAREMTKKFEEVKVSSIREMIAHYQNKTIKGEITIMLAPKK
jgi:16S rRNA (cytidine1402-2'-O)-methyltransferase